MLVCYDKLISLGDRIPNLIRFIECK